MKTRIGLAILAAAMVTGCATTQTVLSKVKNFAIGIYRATPEQVQVADSRATAHYDRLSTAEKQTLKESGTRYLAVRTNDPNPEQLAEIRKEMKKPGGRYGGSSTSNKKVYCVMIWDTYSKEVVGNECYAAVKLPPPNETVRFETYTAQYVGTQ